MVAGGRNAAGGRRTATWAAKVRDHRFSPGPWPAAQRAATWAGTTRSADTRRLEGPTRRLGTAALTAKGRLATTRNGW